MWLLVVFVAVLVAACSGGGGGAAGSGPTTTVAGEHIVDVDNFAFTPQTITVNLGDSVVWEFRQASAPHNVVSLDGPVPFNSGVPQGHGSFRVVFDVAGTYHYICQIHPSMTGTVIVLSA